MATLAVSAMTAGQAFSWTNLALAVGAAYVDQMYVYPALFPQKGSTVYGQRLTDFSMQRSTEGSPIVRAYGPQCRINPTIIWLAADGKKANFEQVRRHKKKKQKWYTYHYYVDVAIAVCKGPLVAYKKIWADGKLLWQEQQNVNITSSLVAAAVFIERKQSITTTYMDVSSPSGGPDLTQLQSGVVTNISGWSNSQNNGSFTCVRSWNAGAGATKARFANSSAVVESAGSSVTFSQALPQSIRGALGSLTLYTGTTTQAADSLLESYEGAGNVPGYRGIAYVVLKDLYLTEHFGNRLPNFAFLVDAG